MRHMRKHALPVTYLKGTEVAEKCFDGLVVNPRLVRSSRPAAPLPLQV
jgi:hypothetical protein